jgi:hypothetical protein
VAPVVTLLALAPVVFCLSQTVMASDCPASGSARGDQWREMMNTEGRATFLDVNKVCSENGRAMAIVRIAKDEPNGHPDFDGAEEGVFVTDCRGNFGVFKRGYDYANVPLRPIGGLGMVVANAVCQLAGLARR